MTITIDALLTWRDVARVGAGEALSLSPGAWARVEQASRIVARIVETGVRAYGVNTGVGALADTVVDRASQSLLSRSIVRPIGEALATIRPSPPGRHFAGDGLP